MLDLFPRLAQRRRSRAGDLSGGEQQMLAVGRALLLNGSLVMMDEPSEGLAPTIVDTLIETVHHLVDEGVAVLVVEQNLYAATQMAERVARDGGRPHRRRDDRHRAARRPATCNAATSASTRSRKRARIENVNDDQRHQRRPDRLEVHGPCPLQRLGDGRPLLRRRPAAGRCTSSCARNADELADVRRPLGLGQDRRPTGGRRSTSDEIDLVDVATPNNVHAEQAIAALEAGKHVACEKPLAGTLADAEAMAAAAATAPGRTFVWFNYRRVPAVALARQLVAEGALGRIYHVRAAYLQSWGGPDTPLLWRFQGDVAGSGAHGDLNAHIVDMVRFVTGEEIVTIEGAIEHTFVTERDRPRQAAPAARSPAPGRRRAAPRRRARSTTPCCSSPA